MNTEDTGHWHRIVWSLSPDRLGKTEPRVLNSEVRVLSRKAPTVAAAEVGT